MDIEENEDVKIMPLCKHCFHNTCIQYWLQTNSSCPNCRSDIRAALR